STYHSVFSRRRWSTWALARALAGIILLRFGPDEPVPLAGDDTVDEHRGAKVYGKGRHRDPVRSTKSYTAWRWGHKWVVLAVLVKFPFATRPWALPVLVALYRTPDWDREHWRRHKTPARVLRPAAPGPVAAAADRRAAALVPGPPLRPGRRRRLRQPRDGRLRASASPPPGGDQPVRPRRQPVRAPAPLRRQGAAPRQGGRAARPRGGRRRGAPHEAGGLLVRRRPPGRRGGRRGG